MSFKKYDGSIWQAINPKQLKGIPYTGTLPAVLTGTKAGYLHRYKIYGNTEQTGGTPTPENPIVPSECGERTENLINVQPFTIESDGRSHYVPLWSGTLPVGTYVISLNQYNDLVSALRNTLRITIGGTTYYESLTSDYHLQSGQHKMAFTISDSSQSVEIQYWGNQLGNDCSYSNTMLNLGSTALPYEPYGYKLPLLSGSTPVDIYLGEVQTTRRIKKLVLTGEEDYTWYKSGTRNYSWYLHTYTIGTIMNTPFYCSHGETVTNVSDYGYGKVYCDNTCNLGIFDSSIDTSTKLKNYFAQQYANGTPVTIWYVLATEEAGIVNEPLRKIGDYADTIDSTQTIAQIPTTANSTTISWAGSGLAPSEFDSIQEWVDNPTYTRVNGEWVADN